MRDDKITSALTLLFKQVEVPKKAKESLRRQLFAAEELTDEQAAFVAAAGDTAKQADKQEKAGSGGNEHDPY